MNNIFGKKRIKQYKFGKLEKFSRMAGVLREHQTGAHAAYAAYFFVLSMIPILLLLLTMVQYTPLTKADVLTAAKNLFPSSVNGLVENVVNQAYARSLTTIPVTVLVALWSAGKGVLAMTSGLNRVYEIQETRNYIFLRIRATFYTLVFLIAIIFSLLLPVFGNTLSAFLVRHLPFLVEIIDLLLRFRTLLSFVVLTVFWLFVYRFLPDRRDTMRSQIPGAVFTSCAWLLISFVFSIYLDIFKGFSDMYGSLTTIILFMLWLYGCMYGVLLGGEVNAAYQKLADRS